MSKKYPLCAILKPAPWQTLEESTDPWRGMDEPTVAVDLNVEDLFWDREATPEGTHTAALAKNMRNMSDPNFIVIDEEDEYSEPFVDTEIWDVDVWDEED